ncbi:MAG: 50S ribosomal protein L3 [Planctomycetota bacterium]
MPVGLLGRKVGMTQVYSAEGKLLPVTVIQAGPCVVLQVRTMDRDGYEAVQLGFLDKPRRLASRAERGHVADIGSKRAKARAGAGVALLQKADCEPQRYVREFRTDGETVEHTVGAKLTVELFNEIKRVDVIGTIKGRGFAGVMKQHGFGGMCASHGVQRSHRAPGSVAGHSTNRGFSGKIKKGKRMSGRWGNSQATIRNLDVVQIDLENNVLLVRGAIPGANGGYVIIRQTNKLG